MNRPECLEIHDRICDQLYGRKKYTLVEMEDKIEGLLRNILPYEEMSTYKQHERHMERFVEENNECDKYGGYGAGKYGADPYGRKITTSPYYHNDNYRRGRCVSSSSTAGLPRNPYDMSHQSQQSYPSEDSHGNGYTVNYLHLWDTEFNNDRLPRTVIDYDLERGSVYSSTGPLYSGKLSAGMSPSRRYLNTRSNSPSKKRREQNAIMAGPRMPESPYQFDTYQFGSPTYASPPPYHKNLKNPRSPSGGDGVYNSALKVPRNTPYGSAVKSTPCGSAIKDIQGSAQENYTSRQANWPQTQTPEGSGQTKLLAIDQNSTFPTSDGKFLDKDDRSRRVLYLQRQINAMLKQFTSNESQSGCRNASSQETPNVSLQETPRAVPTAVETPRAVVPIDPSRNHSWNVQGSAAEVCASEVGYYDTPRQKAMQEEEDRRTKAESGFKHLFHENFGGCVICDGSPNKTILQENTTISQNNTNLNISQTDDADSQTAGMSYRMNTTNLEDFEQDRCNIRSITEYGPVHLSFGEAMDDGWELRQRREKMEKDMRLRFESNLPYQSIREGEFPRPDWEADLDKYHDTKNVSVEALQKKNEPFADELCLTEMVSMLADGIRRREHLGNSPLGKQGGELSTLATDAEVMCLRVAEIESESKELQRSMAELEKNLESL